MSIKDELAAELKDAMKAKDRDRVDVIRSITAEVNRAVTEPGFKGEADDELYRQVMAAYAKKMSKALEEYEGLGDKGIQGANKLRFEVDYLQRWLPEQASEEETEAIVNAAIAELGVDDLSQFGRVMGHVMKRHDGLDGTLVSRLVREKLAAE